MINYQKLTKTLAALILCLFSIFITGCIDLAANYSREKKAALNKTKYGKGQIYSMRGGLGGVFSIGMNRLEDTFEDKYHIHAKSTTWFKAYSLSENIIKRYKAHEINGPIILIGHSLGANDQIKVAKNLEREHIPVALLLTIDAVSPLPVPPNVKEVYNIYKPSYIPFFSGQKINAMNSTVTKVTNQNVSNMGAHVNHWTITLDMEIRKLMEDKILMVLNKSNDNKLQP